MPSLSPALLAHGRSSPLAPVLALASASTAGSANAIAGHPGLPRRCAVAAARARAAGCRDAEERCGRCRFLNNFHGAEVVRQIVPIRRPGSAQRRRNPAWPCAIEVATTNAQPPDLAQLSRGGSCSSFGPWRPAVTTGTAASRRPRARSLSEFTPGRHWARVARASQSCAASSRAQRVPEEPIPCVKCPPDRRAGSPTQAGPGRTFA
jgi:hypothetical protein